MCECCLCQHGNTSIFFILSTDIFGTRQNKCSKLALFAISPQENRSKTVTKKTAIQHRMFGSRLRPASYTGDMGEHEPKRWKPQLLVVPVFFLFDLPLDFAPPKQTISGGGGIGESVNFSVLFSFARSKHSCPVPLGESQEIQFDQS